MSEKNVAFNHINVQVFQLLEDLEVAGQTSNPRGFTCKEADLATLEIDPLYPLMDFESRKFNWRYFAGELAWYLQKTNKIEFINNFSSFWKDICPNGICNSNYGHILLGPHPSTVEPPSFDEQGNVIFENGVNQMEWVYNSLVKDKDSRQAVAFLSSPYYQRNDGTKDFVCTLYLRFWIRKDTLHMKVQMRSNDIFFGLTYDAPWFSTLHQSMYLNLKKIYPELKMGIYYHCADNIHYYDRHFEAAEKILDTNLEDSIQLKLKEPIFEFENGKIKLSDSAIKYQNFIEDMVNSGNLPKEKEFWKEILKQIYDIQ